LVEERCVSVYFEHIIGTGQNANCNPSNMYAEEGLNFAHSIATKSYRSKTKTGQYPHTY